MAKTYWNQRFTIRFARTFSLFLLIPWLALAQHPSQPSAAGLWLGTLHAGARDLRIQMHLQPDLAAAADCSLDSLDQHAFGIPCTVTAKGDAITLVVPSIYGGFTGHLSAKGDSLSGTWSQGGAQLPLTLVRETTAIGPTEASAHLPGPPARSHPNS